jgi:hypothetical protein
MHTDDKKWEFYIGKMLDKGCAQLEIARTGRRSSEFAVVVFSLIAWLVALTGVENVKTVKLPLLDIEVTQEFSKALLPSFLCIAYILSLCAARRWIAWREGVQKIEESIARYSYENKIPERKDYPVYLSLRVEGFFVPSPLLRVFESTLDEGMRWTARLFNLLSILIFHGLAFSALWYYSYGPAAPTLSVHNLELGKVLFYLPMIMIAFLLLDLALDQEFS